MTIRASIAVASFAILLSQGCGPQETPLTSGWTFAVDSLDVGLREGWNHPQFERTGWQVASVGSDWSEFGPGLGSYDGIGWYSAWFTSDIQDPISIGFGGVDDDATVWVNGVEVGDHSGYAEKFFVNIPDSLRADSMLVVVRVMDHGLGGGIYGPVSIMPTEDAKDIMRSPYADKKARVSTDWIRSAVIYEVYLRSFSDDSSIRSLEARLPEIRDLGVTVLWLMPIHPIGELNRKGQLGSPYSIMDFRGVNPEYGSLEDLRSLVSAAHALGMKIILDLVANHTSWDSDLLLRHPDWYTRDDEGAIVSPNADWYDVADLDYAKHELRKYMLDMMRYWVEDSGVDGYRCDVAELVPTDFWVHARHELERVRPVMMLAEGSLPEHHLDAFDLSYAFSTYDILDKLFDGRATARAIPKILLSEESRFPEGSLHMRFHTNHDKNKEDGPPVVRWGTEGALLAAATMFVLPGIPLVYNGEEAGNTNMLSLFEKIPIDWKEAARFRGHYTKLGALRKDQPWLATAPWRDIPIAQAPRTLALMRSEPETGNALMAILNFDTTDVTVDIAMPPEFEGRTLTDQFAAAHIPPAERLTMVLPRHGFSILISH